MRRFLPLVAAVCLVSVGCRERPVNFPLPASFAVQRLSGEHLTGQQMRGSAWVVNFWLPT
jgi:hypothetical protein